MMNPVRKMIARWCMLVVLVAFGGAAFAQSGTGSTQPASDARKACTDAMNADPTFAADIIATQHDKDTIRIHTDADYHVQKNERHVIYAYAAMWIVAALFVIFLWRRQQALQAEIANLRRDLEAAADESKTEKAQA
jgi:C4-dicarboxylate-specific signal transduction histidine kinase